MSKSVKKDFQDLWDKYDELFKENKDIGKEKNQYLLSYHIPSFQKTEESLLKAMDYKVKKYEKHLKEADDYTYTKGHRQTIQDSIHHLQSDLKSYEANLKRYAKRNKDKYGDDDDEFKDIFKKIKQVNDSLDGISEKIK